MKCLVAITLFAMIAMAFADNAIPVEAESIEVSNTKPLEPTEAGRNKRGVLLSAAYTAPIAYAAAAPVAYTSSAAYAAYPYAYTAAAYSSYPYYAAGYSAPYIVA